MRPIACLSLPHLRPSDVEQLPQAPAARAHAHEAAMAPRDTRRAPLLPAAIRQRVRRTKQPVSHGAQSTTTAATVLLSLHPRAYAHAHTSHVEAGESSEAGGTPLASLRRQGGSAAPAAGGGQQRQTRRRGGLSPQGAAVRCCLRR